MSRAPKLPAALTPTAAEASVLGGVLLAPHLLDELRDLHVEHFHDLRHRAVYSAMLALHSAGRPVDATTLETHLTEQGQIDAVGVAFLGELALQVPTPENVAEYAKTVRLAWRNRRALEQLDRARESVVSGFYPAAEVLEETAAELARFAERAPAERKRTYHTVAQVAEGMRSFAKLPWIPFALGGEVIDELPLGESLYLMGSSGSGKTTLALCFAAYHAQHHGPVLIVSRELREEAAGARLGAMLSGQRWADVLRGPGTEDAIRALLELPRLLFLDDQRTTMAHVSAAIDEARADFPGQPIMLLVDYVQIMEASGRSGGEIRQRTTDAVEELRVMIKRQLVIGLVLSQMSRGNSRAARGGERLGADSADGGAETSAIERAAAITAEIGRQTPMAADGSRDVQLSIGKARYGGGDRVIELRQWGASGMTRVLRDEPAQDVREREEQQRETQSAKTRVEKIESAIMESADRRTQPFSREELLADAGLTGGSRKHEGRRVIASLIASGALRELPQRRAGAKFSLLWTRDLPLPEEPKP